MALDLLRTLIRTPSVTGAEGSHPDEHSVSGVLWSSLHNTPGLARHSDIVKPGRDNAMAVLRARSDRWANGGSPPCAILNRPESGADDPLAGAVLRHGASVSGFAPWVETAPGGTDATVMINGRGIRTLVEFGPAGAFAHEPHEYVERDQIAAGARILARTIVEVLGVRGAR